MLIIGRAIAGLGSSGLLNGAYTILNASLPLPKQPSKDHGPLGDELSVILTLSRVSWRSHWYLTAWCHRRTTGWRSVNTIRLMEMV